jgi:putative hemolysin
LIIASVITLLIFITALYVAAEFASVSARRTRIQQMAEAGNRLASMLYPYLVDPHQLDNYVAACQLGITASSLLLGFYGQSQVAVLLHPLLVDLAGMQQAAAESVAATTVLLVLTVLHVLLGELVPKSVGVRFPEQLALLTVLPMRWSVVLMRPLIWIFNGAGRLILRLFRMDSADAHSSTHLPEEIELLVVESAKGGLLDAEERVMLRNVFRLSELVAQQVMIPRPRIEGAPADIPLPDLLRLIADSPYTRVPIYENDIDHIVGVVHLKDIFRIFLSNPEGEVALRDFVRQVPFVPEGMAVDELWSLLKSGHHYMAIVFDEYGGTAGLITLEDLIEEVFGELQDEFDHESPLIARGEDGAVLLRGDVLVDDVNEYLLLELPTGRANTVGGLVTSLLGRPARVDDQLTVGGHTLRVRAVDDLAVTRVSLTLPADAEPILDGERAKGE